MLKMNKLFLLFLFSFFVTFFSCKKGSEKRSPSGMKYVVYKEANGKKPKTGDWVTVNMVYKTDNDSVLFDSRTYKKPLRFELPEPKFPGSFEEGLMCIGEGDSATFYINADSLFLHVISKDSEGLLKDRPKPGSMLKFDVSLVRVQSYEEAELEIALDESRQDKAERTALENYLKEKNITAAVQPEGYYLIPGDTGKGKQVEAGDRITLNYTGRFLNGMEFSKNSGSGQSYTFTVGGGEVIRAWDLAVQKLHEGQKAVLIAPSNLAYGAEGLKKAGKLTYVIPPFSTLVFELEILKIETLAKK